jgi:tetratricopeptide (TPR) repeat protein
LHMSFMKFNTYFRIFNMYTLNGEYAKGISYIGGHPEILSFLDSIGAQFFVDEIYGMAMTERRNYDSALYYFRKGEPEIERKGNPEMQYNFYTFFGNYYQATKAYPAAIVYYKKALEKASAIQGLEYEEAIGDTLKALYEKTGDFKNALSYEAFSSDVRDSIRNQTRATDLMKLEVDNDNRRRDRLAREEEQRVEHRHNLQYMGLTVGLVVLFIGLVMLGRLAVPLSLIRALGFLSFIFLFEFIILLADKPIQAWTAEEPWKVLMIKIVLGAGLVPLHHWLEHKVIHYLSGRRKGGRAAYVKASAANAETIAE